MESNKDLIETQVCYWCDGCGQFHKPDGFHDPRFRSCQSLDYWIDRLQNNESNRISFSKIR